MTEHTQSCPVRQWGLLVAVSFLAASAALPADAQTHDPARTLTERIEFADGQLSKGAPPGATYMPGDPRIDRQDPLTLNPGDQDSLSVTISNLQPQASLEIYIRFGSSADRHIRIQAVSGTSAKETLKLPFEIPLDICDSLEEIKHQVMFYQVVNVADARVSEEQEGTVVLNCEGG